MTTLKLKGPAPLSPIAFPIAGQSGKKVMNGVAARRDFFEPLSKPSSHHANSFVRKLRGGAKPL